MSCDFCPKTKREKRALTVSQFTRIVKEVVPVTKYLYFHILGEPTLHPNLKEFITIANKEGGKVTITTNGTNLEYLYQCVENQPIYKVNISLTMVGGNNNIDVKEYLAKGADFAKKVSRDGTFVVFRLWNKGGNQEKNKEILEILKGELAPFTFNDKGSVKVLPNIYIEGDEKFNWIDKTKDKGFCMGLKDQFGVLADGTVVPCCIDNDGEIPLGNIFNNSINEILNGDRAKNIRKGFMERKLIEDRCKKCGFIEKFN